MRDVETPVHGTLHHGEKLGASCGATESNIQIAFEGSRFARDILHMRLLTVDFCRAFVHLIELQLLQKL